MTPRVTIVVCWAPGTEKMLDACLGSVARHTHASCFDTLLVTRAQSFCSPPDKGKRWREVDVPSCVPVPRVHGAMLDVVIPAEIDTEFVLTLDSDCFPVADGWLEELMGMIKGGATVAGILHPWSPPPESLPTETIEWRVRSQHSWATTHVACQMMRTETAWDLYREGRRYALGDDTGLDIVAGAKGKGWMFDGFKVTRCPIPRGEGFDPEYNRYSCLVYGDKVYHHGAFSRNMAESKRMVFAERFSWCEELVLWRQGAEFLLSDAFGYRFALDREEDVAKEKMRRFTGLASGQMR